MARKFWLGRDDTLEFVKADRTVIGTLDGDTGVLTVNSKPLDGNLRTARVEYDFAVDGGAIGSITLRGQGAIPDNAIIVDGLIDVITTFTSATDAATVALTANSAGDLKAAVAISNGANPWDAGLKDLVPVSTAATSVKLTADRSLVMAIAGEALTAGKMVIFVNYMLGG